MNYLRHRGPFFAHRRRKTKAAGDEKGSGDRGEKPSRRLASSGPVKKTKTNPRGETTLAKCPAKSERDKAGRFSEKSEVNGERKEEGRKKTTPLPTRQANHSCMHACGRAGKAGRRAKGVNLPIPGLFRQERRSLVNAGEEKETAGFSIATDRPSTPADRTTGRGGRAAAAREPGGREGRRRSQQFPPHRRQATPR